MKNPFDVIKKTIQILDSPSYENYSEGKVRTYLKYMEGSRADEDKLISPILFRNFLEDILGFKLGETMATQESKIVGKPDYIPVDNRTHSFVFDAKGTDTQYLSQYYLQIKKYIQPQGLKYGVLTNIRDLDVYTSEGEKEIENYNFSFVTLYQDYTDNPITCMEKENTKRFFNFVENFSYRLLTTEEKIGRIANAKPWVGIEEFNVKLLTDRLRYTVNILHNDVKQQKSKLLSIAEVGKVSPESIASEIEEISAQIYGGELRKDEFETFSKIMKADESTLYGKARDAFFRRVAYFAMTRLLLARVWEDIGFIDESLYDAGFAKWYKNFNHQIGMILNYAFSLSAKRYPWLFNVNNNYSWYEPSDNSLIDCLYELSNFYLGKLDQDILGTIYEEYIERVDKKNKGQYYTPREIVSLIWDRVGFDDPEAFFWHIEGKRRPKLIYDPATGSGGFLVEAAKRIREYPDFDWNDPQDLKDMHDAILWGIFGSEISTFPYYLTQVNLLIQLTPIIKKHIELTGNKPREEPTPLGIICADSLELHNPDPQRLPLVSGEKEKKRGKILHFTLADDMIYGKIKEKLATKFFYCCSNPPYVSEKGHKELFHSTQRLYHYWREYYQGKMDYLYWFVILGLSKLREWGKLGFITSAYWPTADGASKLRKYILENAKIKEMIFFEEVKIFEHAKGQNNMVFIFTKCSDKAHKEERLNNHIKIVQVRCRNQDLPGTTIRENLDFLTKHIQKHIDKPRDEDEFIRVFWSGVKQGELPQDGGSWDEILIRRSEKGLIQSVTERGEPILKVCDIMRGVDSSADRVTDENITAIPSLKIEQFNIKKGDGIFLLSENEKEALQFLPNELDLLKPTYKNSDICPYFVDIAEKLFILYLKKNTDMSSRPNILNHLEKFREILEGRGGHERGESGWYSLHRGRKERILCSNKIVCSRWGKKGPEYFGFQTGEYFEGTDTATIVPNEFVNENVFYILAVLNSALIKKWITEKAQRRGYTAQSILSQIPVHRIDFDDHEEVKMHDEIVDKVKSIREKIADLAKCSRYFTGVRLTKLEFSAPLPDFDIEAIIKGILSENLFNIRTHPELNIRKPKDIKDNEIYLSKINEPENILTGNAQIELIDKDKMSIFIEGPYELLKLIFYILPNWKGKPWDEIKENLLLPKNIQNFIIQKDKILDEVKNIRKEILELQKQIDQTVYILYGHDGKRN